jgi:hypothetical protein
MIVCVLSLCCELFVVAGGEGGASLGEVCELFGVEGWGSSFDEQGRWLGGDCVGEVEGDESSEGVGESRGGGAEGVGEFGVVDGDGGVVVVGEPGDELNPRQVSGGPCRRGPVVAAVGGFGVVMLDVGVNAAPTVSSPFTGSGQRANWLIVHPVACRRCCD